MIFKVMASKDKNKKKPRTGSEWSKTGSFMHKPDRGWIHPDTQLNDDGGICYGVRVGSGLLLIFSFTD